MTSKIRIVLLALFAVVSLSYSFVLWTNTITDSLLSSILVSVDESLMISDTEMHTAAAEDNPQEYFPLAPTTKEPEVSNDSSFIERILKSSDQKELEQWDLSRWVTLSIPSKNIRTPVFLPSRRFWDARQWNLLEEQMQVGLLNGATAYPHSVRPGEIGNVIIAGHSSPPNERAEESKYGHLFASLPTIERGDTITVTGNGTMVTYEVVRTGIVEPTDTEILAQQTDKSLLKLITCYPIGSTKSRFVVTAVKVQ
ncbi:sortase [Patescibacteria group bacterium]|nr:sortase [Patescibacteria group bacterium]